MDYCELSTILSVDRLYEFYSDGDGGSFDVGSVVSIFLEDMLIAKVNTAGVNDGFLALDNSDIVAIKFGTEYLAGKEDAKMRTDLIEEIKTFIEASEDEEEDDDFDENDQDDIDDEDDLDGDDDDDEEDDDDVDLNDFGDESAKEILIRYALTKGSNVVITFWPEFSERVYGKVISLDDGVVFIKEIDTKGKADGVCCTTLDNILAVSCEWE